MTSARAGVKLLNPLAPNAKVNPGFPVRAGGWLFRQRTWIPLPLAAALLFVRPEEPSPSKLLVALGVGFVGGGELLRLWAVRHIGVISRTRGDRLGPVVGAGPFGLVRNPLYLGNIALWTGFALIARLVWLVPVFIVVLGLEYHAIVLWEEQLLGARRGEEYRAYAAQVPRWIPSFSSTRTANTASAQTSGPTAGRYSWRETFFSERGTLIAIGLGCLLLWLKGRF